MLIKLNAEALTMLNTSNWKEFYLSDLFEISGSKTTSVEELEGFGNGKFPYVTTKASDNGVDGFYDHYTEDGNCLTVDSAVLGYCAYQELPFSASDHVEILRPKFQMNQNIALFFVTIINMDTYRYSYGRKRSQKQIKRDIVKLPVDASGNPDWKYMNDFIEEIQSRNRPSEGPLKESIKTNNVAINNLDTSNWKPFLISDLFIVKYGINMELSNCNEDIKEVNFVARTAENNGVSSIVEKVPGKEPQDAGLISVAGGGSVLSTFYQDEPFYSGRDLYTLKAKDDIDMYAKLFIITLIKLEKYKYSYGRQANKTLPYIEIKLPVDSSGKPDYSFMSNYIKSLPYGDKI